MSKFSRFMKQNKIAKENTTFAATKSLVDENGEALLWTIKPLTTRENDDIRDACMVDVPVVGKPGMYRPRLKTSEYIAKMICACVVEPNLYDKDLQDSYGVMTPEELLREMVDDPGEYNDLATFVQNYNGFDATIEDKIDEAKN
jgi:hypothetical protein